MAQYVMTAPARFRVGRVIGDSAKIFARNFVPFVVLSIICGIPHIVVTMLNPALVAAVSRNVDYSAPVNRFSGDRFTPIIISWAVGILCYALTQSTLVYGTVQDLQGRRGGFGAIVARGFKSLLPVAGAAILMALGLTAGFVLLVVPGFILLVMWWVTAPVIVVEQIPITAAFGRSRALTSGHRWEIFGFFVLYGVAENVAIWAVATGARAVFRTGDNVVPGMVAGAFAVLVVAIVFGAYLAVTTAVGYYYLRYEKEGFGLGDLAGVFD